VIFWMTVAILGFFASVVLRAAAYRSTLWWISFGVAVTTSLLILGWVIADGSWWPYVSGMALGSVGWWALDRAAHRIGGRQR